MAGALKFSKATDNAELSRLLEERFSPLLGKQKQLMQKTNHVDNTVFGAIPLELYLQTQNELYYSTSAPFFWGRGNGWMAAGMTELLKHLPNNNKHKGPMSEYKKMMHTLKDYRNSEGLWGQLVDEPQTLWTETSGSAMFTYAMLMGVKHGWLDEKKNILP